LSRYSNPFVSPLLPSKKEKAGLEDEHLKPLQSWGLTKELA